MIHELYISLSDVCFCSSYPRGLVSWTWQLGTRFVEHRSLHNMTMKRNLTWSTNGFKATKVSKLQIWSGREPYKLRGSVSVKGLVEKNSRVESCRKQHKILMTIRGTRGILQLQEDPCEWDFSTTLAPEMHEPYGHSDQNNGQSHRGYICTRHSAASNSLPCHEHGGRGLCCRRCPTGTVIEPITIFAKGSKAGRCHVRMNTYQEADSVLKVNYYHIRLVMYNT